MSDYITRTEILDIIIPIQKCLMESSESAQNITVAMMALFECIDGADKTNEFKASMYDVLQSIDAGTKEQLELQELTQNLLKTVSDTGQTDE